jgi:hypothetical protein
MRYSDEINRLATVEERQRDGSIKLVVEEIGEEIYSRKPADGANPL